MSPGNDTSSFISLTSSLCPPGGDGHPIQPDLDDRLGTIFPVRRLAGVKDLPTPFTMKRRLALKAMPQDLQGRLRTQAVRMPIDQSLLYWHFIPPSISLWYCQYSCDSTIIVLVIYAEHPSSFTPVVKEKGYYLSKTTRQFYYKNITGRVVAKFD